MTEINYYDKNPFDKLRASKKTFAKKSIQKKRIFTAKNQDKIAGCRREDGAQEGGIKEVHMDKVPYHLGIIMDGNRRWAKEKRLPGFDGHRKGAEKVKQIARCCKAMGIKVLTLYAFSTENWNRRKEEVDFLLKLGGYFLDKEIKELHKEGARLLVIGQKERLPASLQKKITKAENLTRENRDLTLVFAISYGGRAEIVEAVKEIIRKGVNATEETISENLYTAGLPDPDLIIRTSGEMRTSGFLLWQSAYSEWYFCQKYWPDFSEDDLDEALAEYARRQRRFGK